MELPRGGLHSIAAAQAPALSRLCMQGAPGPRAGAGPAFPSKPTSHLLPPEVIRVIMFEYSPYLLHGL